MKPDPSGVRGVLIIIAAVAAGVWQHSVAFFIAVLIFGTLWDTQS